MTDIIRFNDPAALAQVVSDAIAASATAARAIRDAIDPSLPRGRTPASDDADAILNMLARATDYAKLADCPDPPSDPTQYATPEDALAALRAHLGRAVAAADAIAKAHHIEFERSQARMASDQLRTALRRANDIDDLHRTYNI